MNSASDHYADTAFELHGNAQNLRHRALYPTQNAALEAARSLNLDSFEIYNENDDLVYQEFPHSVWA